MGHSTSHLCKISHGHDHGHNHGHNTEGGHVDHGDEHEGYDGHDNHDENSDGHDDHGETGDGYGDHGEGHDDHGGEHEGYDDNGDGHDDHDDDHDDGHDDYDDDHGDVHDDHDDEHGDVHDDHDDEHEHDDDDDDEHGESHDDHGGNGQGDEDHNDEHGENGDGGHGVHNDDHKEEQGHDEDHNGHEEGYVDDHINHHEYNVTATPYTHHGHDKGHNEHEEGYNDDHINDHSDYYNVTVTPYDQQFENNTNQLNTTKIVYGNPVNGSLSTRLTSRQSENETITQSTDWGVSLSTEYYQDHNLGYVDEETTQSPNTSWHANQSAHSKEDLNDHHHGHYELTYEDHLEDDHEHHERWTLRDGLISNGSLTFDPDHHMDHDHQSDSGHLSTHQNVTSIPSPTEVDDHFDFGDFAFTTSLLTIGLLAVTLNALVICVLIKTRSFQKASYIFVISLTIADLCVGLSCIAEVSIFSVSVSTGQACVFKLSSVIISCTASILNIVGIAYDRFIAITQPMHYTEKVTIKHALMVAGAIWSVSVVFGSLPAIGWNHLEDYDGCCIFLHAVPRSYILFLVFVGLLPSMILEFYIYSHIFMISRQQAKRIAVVEQNHGGARQGPSRRRTSKALRTLSVIMGCFVVTWVPFFLALLIYLFGEKQYSTEQIVETFMVLIAFSNSFLDPFVYVFWSSRDFRQILKKLCCSRNRDGLSDVGSSVVMKGVQAKPSDSSSRPAAFNIRSGLREAPTVDNSRQDTVKVNNGLMIAPAITVSGSLSLMSVHGRDTSFEEKSGVMIVESVTSDNDSTRRLP